MPQAASFTVRGLSTWNESKDRISAANCPLPNIERKESYPEKTCGKGIRMFYPLDSACGAPLCQSACARYERSIRVAKSWGTRSTSGRWR